VLGNGNFVVSSPDWSNGGTAGVGAVTWVDGNAGLTAVVTGSNSLVGSHAGDHVGSDGVVALGNGNYVVVSTLWQGSGVAAAGAVTWVDGAAAVVAVVDASNSLVGAHAGDHVGTGGLRVLINHNYVVASPDWANGGTANAGAATWGSGTAGISGPVALANSLTGTHANDHVANGGVTALANGNFVVASINWANGAIANAGAVTWGDGASGANGAVGIGNSLIGGTAGDQIGSSGVTALTQGNYVVASRLWDSPTLADVGAATWGDGTHGSVGTVSAANSLVGSHVSDQVSETGIVALSNGNYVVASRLWDDGPAANVGAVTWGSGTTVTSGAVATGNSLIGFTPGDRVGSGGIAALANGNYVVSSPLWDGVAIDVGAATWVDGSAAFSGTVTAGNSLTGATLGDQVGSDGIVALSNGNYVVCSSLWDNGASADAGAATWLDGSAPVVDVVSSASSLVGSTPGDLVGSGAAMALSNGAFVVRSPAWSDGAVTNAGAVTWGSGHSALAGPLSPANSLIGSTSGDSIGSGGIGAFAAGHYVVASPLWDNVAVPDAGAVSLGHGGGIVGAINDTHSVRGTVASGGVAIVYAYDAAHDTLIVGQPLANLVSVFRADVIFTNGFD